MIQLPHEMRDTVVEQLDEYLEAQHGTPDAESVAAYVVEALGTVAEELKLGDADEFVIRLETSGELEASLQEMLEEELERDDELEFSGEEIVGMVEKVCDIEWTTKDEEEEEEADDDEDDDDPDGFFDEMGGEDEEDL